MRTSLAITLALLFSHSLLAAESEGISFDHKDWEMVCDNAHTCRAAGYGVEENAISVLLTREAGAGKNVSAAVVFSDFDDETATTESVTMSIDSGAKLALKQGEDGQWILTPKQTSSLITALIQSKPVVFYQGTKAQEISSSGVNAVLLKMDEFQGRLGTSGALMKKGSKSESGVPPAPVLPKIVAASIFPDSKEKPFPQDKLDALWPALSQTLLNEDSCFMSGETENARKESLRVIALDEKHSLITGACWMAAYNYGSAYWLIDSELKTAPTLIGTDFTYYGNGALLSSQKGRGIGDCWSQDEWTWDGREFQKSQSYTTGACKGIRAGGTWKLYDWVTHVVKP